MKDYEVDILSVLLASWPKASIGMSHWELKGALKYTFYTDTALSLGISNLINKDMIERLLEGVNEELYLYRITPKGIVWLDERKDKLELKVDIPF